jgi:hypothetical protein
MSKNALRYPESAISGGRFGTARVSGSNPIARAAAELSSVMAEPAARSKYGNTKTVVDGITFDSAREAARYSVLSADAARAWRDQPTANSGSVRRGARRDRRGKEMPRPPLRRRLRLSQAPPVIWIVEDVKGMLTPMYLNSSAT